MPTPARVVITPGDRTIRVESVELPDPGPHEVLLRTIATGICHTQITDIEDAALAGRVVALGHEATGEVLAVGGEVGSVRVGDRAFVTWLPKDGGPLTRPASLPQLPRGDGPPATSLSVFTWADHMLCDELFVVPLPDDVPAELAAIVGCAVMTGAGAALNTADVQAGDSVVVFGVGGVGISTIVAAAARGANPIIAVDVDDAKLEWARRQGATHGVNARAADPVEAVHDLTRDDAASLFGVPVSGADHAFDCIGGSVALKQILPSLRTMPRAIGERSRAVVVGLPRPSEVEIDAADLMVNKELMGCIGGSCVPLRDFPVFCDWIRDGRLDLDAIVTRRYALDDIVDAVAALDTGEITGRAIITF
jgi:Zn-dependent alcohol dehydrogenase